MATQTFEEGQYTGEHIVSEANGARSREQVTLVAGNLPAGAVLALNAAGDYVPHDPDANDGEDPPAPTSAATPVAVLYAPTDASEDPARCVIHRRDCEVHGELLTWKEDATPEQIEAGIEALAESGIIVR